jgi:hypothetical protein
MEEDVPSPPFPPAYATGLDVPFDPTAEAPPPPPPPVVFPTALPPLLPCDGLVEGVFPFPAAIGAGVPEDG